MSTRYPGGFITRNPVAPTSASASGIWTQDQVLQYVRSGTWPQVYVPIYIEDVFSTYLYTGNSSTQTITNGIDLSTKGGLVWIKGRNQAYNNNLFDTARGTQNRLNSNTTGAAVPAAGGVTSFNTNGFTLDSGAGYNDSPNTFVSWTFREQAKFFDVVTYTGNGSSTQTINHSLGSVPGCIIIKVTSQADDWYVYHRSLSQSSGVPYWLNLNTTAAETFFGGGIMLNATPTSTSFTVKGGVNGNGNTYVAYLFAHDAGGFGATGTDNVISCGSYTGNGSATGPTINLGWEPQWLLVKPSTVVDNWNIIDNMRGATVSGSSLLYANATNAEGAVAANIAINATGFQPNTTNSGVNGNGQTYIYIAIRRGPMKTPTSGTSVFLPQSPNASGSFPYVTTGWPVDMGIVKTNKTTVDNNYIASRLIGDANQYTNTTGAVINVGGGSFTWDSNVGWLNLSGANLASWNFRRAPGFFDVVCYTGTGSATTFNHNLTVVPELMIIKKRNSATNGGWLVGFYVSASTGIDGVGLNDTAALSTRAWSSGNFNSAPTASVFGVGSFGVINALADTYVAYLFATCAGVSKVGSYTGTGTTLQVDCGFTAGARFVMIKRTDSTGGWYVWDSARGIVAGNDPYLLLNSTAAEVTNTDYVDTSNAGFEISSTAPAEINANGGTFIFLAIA